MRNKLLLITISIVLFLSCNKNMEKSSKINSTSENASNAKSNSPEVPLNLYKNNSPNENIVTTVYGCGSNLSGSYGGTGYYTYPANTLDLTTTSYAAQISISVGSYDVPNRFTIYDANNNYVAGTSWMGYANYSGPWGMSLNTPQTQTITFDKKNTTYTLKVETSTTSISDSWYASVSCQSAVSIDELTNQQIIDIYSNVGVPHNEGLDYVLQGLKNYYGPVYNGGNSKAAHDLMYQNIDNNTKDYLITKRSVSQSDANSCINNFKNSPVKEFGTNLNTNITYSPYYSTLSAKFKTAIRQLNTLIHDEANCYTKANYDAIVSNNIALLPNNNEKVYLVSMCNVGYNSIIYWRDNYSKWQSFFGTATVMKANPAKDIAVADVTGIITGAVGGCAWGALGGTVVLPGAGTITGCAGVGAIGALGGGLGNSAKKAAESFVSWLFS